MRSSPLSNARPLTPRPFAALGWEVLYHAFKIVCKGLFGKAADDESKVPKDKRPRGQDFAYLRDLGASYMVSMIHCTYVIYRGLGHFVENYDGPRKNRMVLIDDEMPWGQYGWQVEFSAGVFISYILYDAVHVILNYPRLGGWDTIIHHILFFFMGLFALYTRICIFLFSVLILGEASTPFLNMRTMLIKTGNGATTAMSVMNMCFASTFFFSRIVLYGWGLYDSLGDFHYASESERVQSLFSGKAAAEKLVAIIQVLLVVTFLLDCYWMANIFRMAFCPKKSKGKKGDKGEKES